MPCEVNFSRSQPPKHKTIVQRTVSGPSFPFFAHGLRLTILLCNGVKGLLDVNAGRGREQHKVTSDSLVTICERPWPWLGTHQRQGASCVTGRPPSMMTVLAKCRVLMLRGGGNQRSQIGRGDLSPYEPPMPRPRRRAEAGRLSDFSGEILLIFLVDSIVLHLQISPV